MKRSLFFIFSTITFITANGQDISGKLKSFRVLKDSVIVNNNYAFNVPNAKLLYETGKGKIYQLPLDNMRCLVPDINSQMPVYKALPKIAPVPIPNPYAGKNIIITSRAKP